MKKKVFKLLVGITVISSLFITPVFANETVVDLSDTTKQVSISPFAYYEKQLWTNGHNTYSSSLPYYIDGFPVSLQYKNHENVYYQGNPITITTYYYYK